MPKLTSLYILVYKKSRIILFIGFLLTILFTQRVEAEGITPLRNPFESWFHIREREEAKHKKEEIVLEEPKEEPKAIEFKVTGILQGKRNLAIINDEIVGEGDIIEGRKVVQIDKKRVVLKGLVDRGDIILEIKDEY